MVKFLTGDCTVEEVHSEVYKIASEVMDQAGDKPLHKLWTDGNIC